MNVKAFRKATGFTGRIIQSFTGAPADSRLLPQLPPRAERRRALNKKPVAQNIAVQGRDGMPVEVAESMLFSPLTKLTTAMRKNCLAARETVFVSTREGKDYFVRLQQRAKKASAAQLVKWARRVTVQRAEVQRDYLKLSITKSKLDQLKLHEIARANRLLAIMDIKAQQLDAQMASFQTEAEARLNRVKKGE